MQRSRDGREALRRLYEYRARIRSIHDGDSLRADIDLGFGIWITDMALRLHGLDAPELGTDAGRAARDYLRSLLPTNAEVVIRTHKDRTEKYGRMLAEIAYGNGTVNFLMILEGHAKPWNGQGARP